MLAGRVVNTLGVTGTHRGQEHLTSQALHLASAVAIRDLLLDFLADNDEYTSAVVVPTHPCSLLATPSTWQRTKGTYRFITGTCRQPVETEILGSVIHDLHICSFVHQNGVT